MTGYRSGEAAESEASIPSCTVRIPVHRPTNDRREKREEASPGDQRTNIIVNIIAVVVRRVEPRRVSPRLEALRSRGYEEGGRMGSSGVDSRSFS